MRAAEQRAITAGTSEWELLQSAGKGCAAEITAFANGKRVTVLCGPGNNGGDGYVIAEALRKKGVSVRVVALTEAETPTAAKARDCYNSDVESAHSDVEGDILVDCLFGTGLSRPLDPDAHHLLMRNAALHQTVVAVDLPSGVVSNTGEILNGELPKYDYTFALGSWKNAHFLMPSSALLGKRIRVGLGLEFGDVSGHLFGKPAPTPPDFNAHKYSRGMVAIVGGEMHGAAILASEAAMRAGAGYVKLAGDTEHPAVPADLVVDPGPLEEVLGDKRLDAVLIGPGLGRNDTAKAKLEAVFVSGKPAVFDADALHLITPAMFETSERRCHVLTPHEGELAVLCEAFGIDRNTKLEKARKLAETTGCVVAAKGADTIVAAPSAPIRFFKPASSWLSAAGTGDVLAGVVVSRMAAGEPPLEAASQAVWLHGEAARQLGPAFTAGELARQMRHALATCL